MNRKTYTYYTDEGYEDEIELPVKMEVCGECEGHGTVLCEGMRHHAYSSEEFEREFSDAEDREAYFRRGGKYDVQCPECKGRNVVPVVDLDRLTEAQKPVYELIQRQWESEARYRAEDAQIRRMESGGYDE